MSEGRPDWSAIPHVRREPLIPMSPWLTDSTSTKLESPSQAAARARSPSIWVASVAWIALVF